MNHLKVFLWAALHSPEFNRCMIRSPIKLEIGTWNYGYAAERLISFTFRLRWGYLYIPSSVLEAYREIHPEFGAERRQRRAESQASILEQAERLQEEHYRKQEQLEEKRIQRFEEASKRRSALQKAKCSTYILGNGQQAILCLCCGVLSHNLNNAQQKYCNFCREFHSGGVDG